MSGSAHLHLIDICDIQIGRTPSRAEPRYWGDGYRWLAIADLKQGRDITSTAEQITEAAVRECNCKIVRAGTIVFSFKLSLGKVGIVREDMYTNEAIAALRIRDSNAVDTGYLYHALRALDLRGKGEQAVKGLTMNSSSLAQLSVRVPSLLEQRRIAAILDKADAILRASQGAFELTHELSQSIFLDLFGEPVQNTKGWQIATLGELIPDRTGIVDGPFGSSLKPDSYVNSGIPVIRNYNIKDGWFDASQFKYVTEAKFAEIKRSEAMAGDVLLSTKGTIGNACLMPHIGGRAVLSASGTVRIRLPANSSVIPHFLMALILTPSFRNVFRRAEAGTNQKYLTLAMIRRLRLIVPPREDQENFQRLCAFATKLEQRQAVATQCVSQLLTTLESRSFA